MSLSFEDYDFLNKIEGSLSKETQEVTGNYPNIQSTSASPTFTNRDNDKECFCVRVEKNKNTLQADFLYTDFNDEHMINKKIEEDETEIDDMDENSGGGNRYIITIHRNAEKEATVLIEKQGRESFSRAFFEYIEEKTTTSSVTLNYSPLVSGEIMDKLTKTGKEQGLANRIRIVEEAIPKPKQTPSIEDSIANNRASNFNSDLTNAGNIEEIEYELVTSYGKYANIKQLIDWRENRLSQDYFSIGGRFEINFKDIKRIEVQPSDTDDGSYYSIEDEIHQTIELDLEDYDTVPARAKFILQKLRMLFANQDTETLDRGEYKLSNDISDIQLDK